MRRLVIIGNGFDRAHGLKTSYSEFIEYLVRESINHNEKVRNELFDVGFMKTEEKDYAFIRKNFDKLAHTKNEDQSGRIRFKNRLLCGMMMNSFSSDWFNVEDYYFNAICGASASNKEINYIGTINEDFEQIKNWLENYLVTLIENQTINLNKRFETIFQGGFPESLLIVNFNYTPVANMYMPLLRQVNNKKIIHIHGELKSDENPIIFGHGDDVNTNYTRLINQPNRFFVKNFKRLLYKNWDTYDQIRDFINDRQDYEVYSIGHSLGVSDKTLLSEILNNQKVYRIKLFYHKNLNGYQNLINNLVRIVHSDTLNKKVMNFRQSEAVPQFKKNP